VKKVEIEGASVCPVTRVTRVTPTSHPSILLISIVLVQLFTLSVQ
jgi:hypothetical protein